MLEKSIFKKKYVIKFISFKGEDYHYYSYSPYPYSSDASY